MPDNTVLKLGSCLWRAPEILFRPEQMGEECPGVHQLLLNSIQVGDFFFTLADPVLKFFLSIFNLVQTTDFDIRKTMYQNILLSGGATLMRGFGERLLDEVF